MAALATLRPPPPVIVVDNASAGSVIRPWAYPGPGPRPRPGPQPGRRRPHRRRPPRTHPLRGLLRRRLVVGPGRPGPSRRRAGPPPSAGAGGRPHAGRPGAAVRPTNEAMARSPLPGDPALPGRPVLGCVAGATVVRQRPSSASAGSASCSSSGARDPAVLRPRRRGLGAALPGGCGGPPPPLTDSAAPVAGAGAARAQPGADPLATAPVAGGGGRHRTIGPRRAHRPGRPQGAHRSAAPAAGGAGHPTPATAQGGAGSHLLEPA